MNQGKKIYICPMHSDVKSDNSGRCPKCGMKLEISEPKEEMNMDHNKHKDHPPSHKASEGQV